jgi:putative membrane protein
MMWGYSWNWGAMLLMGGWMLLWLLVLGGVIWALARVLMRSSQPATPGGQAPDRALDLLRERYARGEVDAETYESMRARLRGTSPQ